ncbi:MAG TPA: hypothetical protein VKX39_18430 [Bryobacteraceae bacterium]|nr:hypothetical protein [Bryobacteraceae bacterium]
MIYRIAVLVAGFLVIVGAHAQDASEAAKQAAHEEIARSNDLLAKIPSGKLTYGTESARDVVLKAEKELENEITLPPGSTDRHRPNMVLSEEQIESRHLQRIETLVGVLRKSNDVLTDRLASEDLKRKADTSVPPPKHDFVGDNINLWVWVVVLVVGTFFVIPTIVAFLRRHRSRWDRARVA